MPEIVQLHPRDYSGPSLPPTYIVKFTPEEFPAFLADPRGTLAKLGHPVENLHVSVKDHVWDSSNEEWVVNQDDPRVAGIVSADLPAVKNWGWWCGYQDEQCVCERVLM